MKIHIQNEFSIDKIYKRQSLQIYALMKNAFTAFKKIRMQKVGKAASNPNV
jgi:hypothetical protein